MKFRTELDISPFSFSIRHSDSTVLLGSCFSNNIGIKLKEHYFPTSINPHGIIFNPVSLARLVTNSLTNKTFKLDDANNIAKNGNFYSYHHHSQLSSTTENGLNSKIEEKNAELKSAIFQAKTLFVTLGTAWVYELIATKKIVANCHKTPADQFTKRLLAIEEIKQSCEQIVSSCLDLNPELQIVFTVSPIRHIKDGIVENQISKSMLFAGIQSTLSKYDNCNYFPSYELMQDDLRDYRFYDKDLIHPNEMAIEYIWKKFGNAFFSTNTHDANAQIKKLRNAMTHRVMQNDEGSLSKFVKSSIALCMRIEEKVALNLEKEKQYFANLLA